MRADRGAGVGAGAPALGVPSRADPEPRSEALGVRGGDILDEIRRRRAVDAWDDA